MGKNSDGVFYRTTLVKFLDRFVRIVLQNEYEDDNCFFVSFCNVLLLRGDVRFDFDMKEVSQQELLSLIGERLINSEHSYQEITDALDLLPNISKGIHVDVRFARINDYEPIRELAIFDLFDISLYHGWIVDPQDTDTASVIGSKSYSAILRKLKGENESALKDQRRGDKEEEEALMTALALSRKEAHYPLGSGHISGEDYLFDPGNRTCEVKESDSESDNEEENYLFEIGEEQECQLMQNFLDNSPSQMTYYGLFRLMNGVIEEELCIFFRNNRFSTMFKYKGELYLLEITEGDLNQEYMLWKKLNEVAGDPVFVTGTFEEFDTD